MNHKPFKKPRFYFNSQEAARTTIFWLFVIGLIFLAVTYFNLESYRARGFISVPRRSGPWVEIHGPDAMPTIYTYGGCSVFFFGLGAYFLFLYFRIKRTEALSSRIFVPEHCIPREVVCPSCLRRKTVCDASDGTCLKCNIQMEDRNSFLNQHPLPQAENSAFDSNFARAVSKYEDFYKSLYPDFNELSVFLIGFVLFLLFLFNPECRREISEIYKPVWNYTASQSLIRFLFLLAASLAVISGVLLSFTHLLVVARKDRFSVFCMKAFALIMLAYIGIKSGLYVMENQNYLLIVSPAWNLILGAVCYSGLGMMDEVPFDQSDSRFMQTFLSVLLVSIIFCFLNFVLGLYWPVILSICVNYVICINKGAINSKFLKLYSIFR